VVGEEVRSAAAQVFDCALLPTPLETSSALEGDGRRLTPQGGAAATAELHSHPGIISDTARQFYRCEEEALVGVLTDRTVLDSTVREELGSTVWGQYGGDGW